MKSNLERYVEAVKRVKRKKPKMWRTWTDTETSTNAVFAHNGDLSLCVVTIDSQEPYEAQVVIPYKDLDAFIDWLAAAVVRTTVRAKREGSK